MGTKPETLGREIINEISCSKYSTQIGNMTSKHDSESHLKNVIVFLSAIPFYREVYAQDI